MVSSAQTFRWQIFFEINTVNRASVSCLHETLEEIEKLSEIVT